MALPRIDTPTYQTNLPSTGETVQYRPFLVKEQKIMMLAQESEDEKQQVEALSKLVAICTFNKVDVIHAPTFDVEHLFLKIRSKSVGESVDISVTCPDDEKTQVRTKINIDDIKVQTHSNHSDTIHLTDRIKMILRYPSLSDIQSVGNAQTAEGIFKLLYRCINEIHHNDDVYHRIDMSDNDIEEFVDQLTSDQFEKITNFFQTMPKLSHKVSIVNPKTKVQGEVVLEGLQSFLG
tara:strand:- start:1464 stop:2168 length:705 start_codon:yes stop_codon:yes gene_type:complete